jgi:hypothetical protein
MQCLALIAHSFLTPFVLLHTRRIFLLHIRDIVGSNLGRATGLIRFLVFFSLLACSVFIVAYR